MTTPWLDDSAWAPRAPMLGWWGRNLAAMYGASAGGRKTTSSTGSATVSFTLTVTGDGEDVLLFIAAPGSFAGAYNWGASGIPGLKYQSYVSITGADSGGALIYYAAQNVPAGTYTVTVTVTGAATDTITTLHAAAIAYNGTTGLGQGYWWGRGNAAAISYSHADQLPGDRIISCCYSTISQSPPVTAAGSISRYTEPGAVFQIIDAPATGASVAFTGTQSAAGAWAEMSIGLTL